MKKGFVISWFYPPGNSSEGLVTYKLLKRSKYNYDVWTREIGDESGLWDRNIIEDGLLAKNINVIQAKVKNVQDWTDQAIQYFIKHRDEYDFIMTRSMPPEAHRIGKVLKEKYPNLKWVASYGDPIIDTPYLKIQLLDQNPFNLKHYHQKENLSLLRSLRVGISPVRLCKKYIWEKDQKYFKEELVRGRKINDYTISQSDLFITNNLYQKDFIFCDKYQKLKKKVAVLPHSFDSDLYHGDPEHTNKKIIFSYFGHLDFIRNATPLLKAIAKLKEQDKNLHKLVEFHFYGHMDDVDKLIIINEGIFDLVFLHGDISYTESLAKMQESDWNLLFDANFVGIEDKNIFFPAKLADYLGAGTNIFAITQLEGASADIIRKTGSGVISTHSVDDVFMKLAKIIYKNFTISEHRQNEIMKFSNKNVSKLLDTEIDKLLKD